MMSRLAAFLGGITGQLYRQFALTIAVTIKNRPLEGAIYVEIGKIKVALQTYDEALRAFQTAWPGE